MMNVLELKHLELKLSFLWQPWFSKRVEYILTAHLTSEHLYTDTESEFSSDNCWID